MQPVSFYPPVESHTPIKPSLHDMSQPSLVLMPQLHDRGSLSSVGKKCSADGALTYISIVSLIYVELVLMQSLLLLLPRLLDASLVCPDHRAPSPSLLLSAILSSVYTRSCLQISGATTNNGGTSSRTSSDAHCQSQQAAKSPLSAG